MEKTLQVFILVSNGPILGFQIREAPVILTGGNNVVEIHGY